MYSAPVLDHFENPRNVGELERPDASARLENPACGDVLQLTLKTAGGRITQARFRARGCVAAIACGSKLTELILDRTLAEASALGWQELASSLQLPSLSEHASHLAIDVLAAALKQLDT